MSRDRTSHKSPRTVSAPLAESGRELRLTPVQRAAYDKLERLIGTTPVVALNGVNGIGKTTIVNALATRHGGRVINAGRVFTAVEPHHGAQWEEALEAAILDAMAEVDLVVIDDFSSLVMLSMTMSRMTFFRNVVAKRLFETAEGAGKRIVLVGSSLPLWGSMVESFSDQALLVTATLFGAEDYALIAANILGDARVANIDFRAVQRHSGALQGYQLRLACQLLGRTAEPITTEHFLTCLATYVASSNTRIAEVETLSFDALPGAEHITQALEDSIVLPFEHPELAAELGLKPTRGVLLYGPPGTGKTSIGRALAHRIKGKFFLIDGTFVTEPPTAFFEQVHKVVDEAKESSPSVLFIDDADVLFKIDHVAGLSRYLLSLLDGLESATAGNVCVMMTAMDAWKIPEALLRSGRVELWLETRAPDAATRVRILRRWMGADLPGHEDVDYGALAAATEGCTPADLRRLVRDAKTLYAADIASGTEDATATDYVVRAVDEMAASRDSMARLLGDDRLRLGATAA